MEWHRDGNGGYVGEHGDMDAQATITRVNPYSLSGSGRKRLWEVAVVVFGTEVDRRSFPRLDDAKWHASHVASLAAVNDWPREGSM